MTATGRTMGTITETCTITTAWASDVQPGQAVVSFGTLGTGDGLWIVDRVDGCAIHCRRPKWHERALYHARKAWGRLRGLRRKASRTALTVQFLKSARMPFLSPRFVDPPKEKP